MRATRPARYASWDASCGRGSELWARTISEDSRREERMNGVTDTQRFVGVWKLEGIEEEDFLEGKRGQAPGFERAVGLLIYLASGWMSVNFAGLSRPPFLMEFSPTFAALAAAGSA